MDTKCLVRHLETLRYGVVMTAVMLADGCAQILGIEELSQSDPVDAMVPSGFVLRGTATGVVGRPVALELRIDGDSELLPVTQDGTFAFRTRLETGASYIVVLADPNVPCVLRNNVGVIAGADVAIELTCSPSCAVTECNPNRVCDDSSGTATCACADGFADDGNGGCFLIVGCADGVREGFVDVSAHPSIAGCSGGWSVPGVITTITPACNGQAGDDSANVTGTGCNIADLCGPGWHVCATPAEVAAASPDGCTGATQADDPSLFFATRQSGPGDGVCGDGANDFFGCGNLGTGANPGTCAPLNHSCGDVCSSVTADWSCGTDSFDEANNAIKTGPAGGGALCCRDEANAAETSVPTGVPV